MDIPQAPDGALPEGVAAGPPAGPRRDTTPPAEAPPAPTAASDGTQLPPGISEEPPASTAAPERPGTGPAGALGRPPRLVSTELRVVGAGAVRLLWWWPGIALVLAVYIVVAVSLHHHLYPNLWGGLAAAVAALAWYGSPLRRVEARRRDRLRAGGRA